ncbi:MAG: lactonase family protein [Nannocystaceae bacterium]
MTRALGFTGLLGGLLLGCGDSAGGGGPGPELSSTSTATDGDTGATTTATTTTAADSSGTTGSTTSPTTGEDSTGQPPAEGSFWVFVSVQGRVSTWSMDPATGALSFERELPFDGPGGPLAVDPQQTTLYVAVRSADRADAFAIDPLTADLLPMGQVGLGLDPVYLRTDQTGRHLLTATFGGDQIAIFPIGDDGSLGGAATQVLATPEEPHSILTDPSNQWLLVPHRTPDVIGQYAFDPTTGTATPNVVPQVAAMPGSGPRHMVFHPDGDYAYVADEFSDRVSSYGFDAGTGQLTLMSTVSTLPEGFDGSANTCADIHVTPDGRFVYVSNRGHDSLAMFAVDEGTGQLGSLGQVPTEARPREFELSPRGRYAFAAGQDSNMMASYAIDQATGMLSPGPVYDVGEEPLWVLAVELPPVP